MGIGDFYLAFFCFNEKFHSFLVILCCFSAAQMSSDEEDPASPVLPKDSDRGSSVSSELQVAKMHHKMTHYSPTIV